MMSSYTLRSAKLPSPLNFLVSLAKISCWLHKVKMSRKSAILLVGLPWSIFWVTLAQLTILCPFKFWLVQISYETYCIQRSGVMVITTAQHHSTKPRLSFCTGSNLACGVLEICMVRISDNGPTQMEVRLINNTTKTIHHHHHHHHYCITKYLFFYKLVDFSVKYLGALGQIRLQTHPMVTSYQVILLNLEQLKKLLGQTLLTRWIDPSLHQGKGQLGQKLCKLILLICSPTIFLK